ncbi:hypothetical protein C2G38_2172388 [Gigaspora rosea]|uniref:Uncharacterized protein n=1 Tax=Gigaspora rosea TaxID=44941 RepID=A0A397VKM1_9GLOM|nr:hypothetical protein C2G38_2172388 [Gigaspora rosea]
MWRDCFNGSPKSEPSSILNIRRLIIISSFIMLLGSIIALFFKMSKEQPIISTTFYSVDTLPAPGVDSIRLWGVVHSGCCGIRLFKEKTKKIINNDLESVITSDSNILNSSRDPQASSQDLQESSKDSQNITSRIEELEKFRCFIEMNVIKIKPWEGHIKVKPSKKGNNTELLEERIYDLIADIKTMLVHTT